MRRRRARRRGTRLCICIDERWPAGDRYAPQLAFADDGAGYALLAHPTYWCGEDGESHCHVQAAIAAGVRNRAGAWSPFSWRVGPEHPRLGVDAFGHVVITAESTDFDGWDSYESFGISMFFGSTHYPGLAEVSLGEAEGATLVASDVGRRGDAVVAWSEPGMKTAPPRARYAAYAPGGDLRARRRAGEVVRAEDAGGSRGHSVGPGRGC